MRDRKRAKEIAQKKKEGVKKIEDDITANLKTHFANFKQTLESYVINHRDALKRDPAARAEFFDIC